MPWGKTTTPELPLNSFLGTLPFLLIIEEATQKADQSFSGRESLVGWCVWFLTVVPGSQWHLIRGHRLVMGHAVMAIDRHLHQLPRLKGTRIVRIGL